MHILFWSGWCAGVNLGWTGSVTQNSTHTIVMSSNRVNAKAHRNKSHYTTRRHAYTSLHNSQGVHLRSVTHCNPQVTVFKIRRCWLLFLIVSFWLFIYLLLLGGVSLLDRFTLIIVLVFFSFSKLSEYLYPPLSYIVCSSDLLFVTCVTKVFLYHCLAFVAVWFCESNILKAIFQYS